MPVNTPTTPAAPVPSPLAKEARDVFLRHLGVVLPEMANTVANGLQALIDKPTNKAQAFELRDMQALFLQLCPAWMTECRQRLGPAAVTSSQPKASSFSISSLELVDDDAVEQQILAGRLAQAAMDRSGAEFGELRVRLQSLERVAELDKDDSVQPAFVANAIVSAWWAAGLDRKAWIQAQSGLQKLIAEAVAQGHRLANTHLKERGVGVEVDLRQRIRRPAETPAAPASPASPAVSQPSSAGGAAGAAPGAPFPAGSAGPLMAAMAQTAGRPQPTMPGGRPAAYSVDMAQDVSERVLRFLAERLPSAMPWWPSSVGGALGGGVGVPSSTGGAPLGSVAAGVGMMPVPIGAAVLPVGAVPMGPVPVALPGAGLPPGVMPSAVPGWWAAQLPTGVALAAHVPTAEALSQAYAPTQLVDWQTVEASASGLHKQTRALKAAAGTDHEKAVIEMVALIFDSILSEDRIPPGIRVWFARLQMPVLRNAVLDPTFLTDPQHPARALLDRMGSCVMGFDASVSIEPLQKEIKRVVQVIEQYPETGRRVFELTLKEFQAFLAKHLSAQGEVARIVNVAQQVEQKETLSVQYTIELRKMLGDKPLRDELRAFLFQVWAEVMAVAAVRHGAQDPAAQALRQAAVDLLWASGSKPTRQERAQVITKLPALLQKLREGMGLLGYDPERQEGHIKRISDTLTDAFMSRSEPISQTWLAELTQHFAELEAYMPEGQVAPFELDRDSVEMITGVDASNVVVLPNLDVPQSGEALLAAGALALGAWFDLDHNGEVSMLQLVWTSEQKQFTLLADRSGRSYLFQQGRLAHYLQAGLLRPAETESLTVRATRDAMEKLDANPERLLA